MNLLSDYQIKIQAFLKKLNSKKIIITPNKFHGLTVELPPKNNKADINLNINASKFGYQIDRLLYSSEKSKIELSLIAFATSNLSESSILLPSHHS